MKKGISTILIVTGAVLIFLGVDASESFNSDVSRFFRGRPSKEAVWLLVGGVVLVVIGISDLFRGQKGRSD